MKPEARVFYLTDLPPRLFLEFSHWAESVLLILEAGRCKRSGRLSQASSEGPGKLPFNILVDTLPREGTVRLRLIDCMSPKTQLSSPEEEKSRGKWQIWPTWQRVAGI